MGVVASRDYNNTPLLNLCKERKKLIRAARDARYHLARSYLLYFRSLLDLSNFLNQFVHKELIVIPFSSDDDSSSTDLICCGSDLDSVSDSDRIVCDRSQTVPLSDNVGLNPRKAAPGGGTCGSSNYVQKGMENSGECFLEFEKKVFVNVSHEYETKGSQISSSFERNLFMGHDILGLYDFVEQRQSFYIKPDQRDEVESDGLREIREREGIPDLEPETETESIHNSQKKKDVKGSSSVAIEIDQRDIEANTCNGYVTVVPDKSNEIGMQETHKPTEVVTEQVTRSDEEVFDEAYESSSSSSFSESSGLELTDLRIVVETINHICEKAVSNSGIPEFLEVSRVVHHQPLGSQFKGFASRVLGSSGNSICNLQPKRGLVLKENLAGSLLMTLETLYMWEKKLFAEVTVEEKLRISYDKAYEILRALDQSGAESSEIYEAETVVNHQLSKLNVSVRAVESISMRIHKIRDEELSFQVIEIINGFKHMWGFLAKCHHKQFLIIAKSKSCIQIVEKGSSSRKATQKVEERIRRYRESLRGYIDAQRNFVKLLNEWLNLNILEDDDSKIEAPKIFQVCSQWLREIENVDENEVLSAIEEMELKFRELGFKQEEEVKQRLRKERLCKELEKETKELEQIWGTEIVFPASDSAPTTKMMVGPELLPLRERVTQERAKHERLLREVNDAVSISLQECLVHVFDALEEFCFANFKAYRNIRITFT